MPHRVNMMLQNTTRRLPSFFTVQVFKRVCSLIHVLHVTLKSRFGEVRCKWPAWCLQCWKVRKLKKNREKQNLRFAYTQTSFVVGNCVECNQQKIVSECKPSVTKKKSGMAFARCWSLIRNWSKKVHCFHICHWTGIIEKFPCFASAPKVNSNVEWPSTSCLTCFD